MKAILSAIALASVTLAGAASAQDATSSYTTRDRSVTVQMPCSNPIDASQGTVGLEGQGCFDGDAIYLFIASQGRYTQAMDPWSPNFDEFVAEIRADAETVRADVETIDGRRVFTAEAGGDGGPIFLQAVELAPQHIAYVVTIIEPTASKLDVRQYRTVNAAFAASLEVRD